MEETKQIEKEIYRLKQKRDYEQVFLLTKKLYADRKCDSRIAMIYANCLIMAGDFKKAEYVINKLYPDYSLEVDIFYNLFNISFESFQFENSEFYLNKLKAITNKNVHINAIPYEIYFANFKRKSSDDICRNPSSKYLDSQIKNYSRDKAIDFIQKQNKVSTTRFNQNANITGLFYQSLNYVSGIDRGIQINPLSLKVCFFDKYYMPYYLEPETPYRFIEISTIPFTNHICMIQPCKSDNHQKKLILPT